MTTNPTKVASETLAPIAIGATGAVGGPRPLLPRELDLEAILDRIATTRITVFGDFCLDAYWWLEEETMPEKSIETGNPTRQVRRQRYTLGGAGNTIANLVDLGVKDVRAIGVVGDDLFGTELKRLLDTCGADTSGMITLKETWHTSVYAKPYSGETEECRFDFGAFNELPTGASDAIASALERAAGASDVVLVNQQLTWGVNTPAMIECINAIIAGHPSTKFIVDARDCARLYSGSILKLNIAEAVRYLSNSTADEDRISSVSHRDLGVRIWQKTNRSVFLTRGERGLIVVDQGTAYEIPGIQVIERTDPVGAGDTVAAAIAAVIGSDGGAVEAAIVADLAASITVRKMQTTGTATPDEILACGREADYIYEPDLAASPRLARFATGTDIEIVRPLPQGLRIRHAIFDHDGTISTLREGWERIMEPMMIKAILGPRFADADENLYRRVEARARDFIDKTTGIQTLVQMQGLVRLVREFGFIPETEVLDEHGYKGIYNDELLAMVRERVGQLERGELEAPDFQLKSAARFLEELRCRGVKLYLASGTDDVDVKAEAEALGYSDVFEGRIFGAVGDVNVEAKKLVLERIIREYELSGEEFATFGDGPVEIRETNTRGGVSIGVASDEVRRFGINQSKRSRLIRAGAQLIVPDFSQFKQLLSLLELS